MGVYQLCDAVEKEPIWQPGYRCTGLLNHVTYDHNNVAGTRRHEVDHCGVDGLEHLWSQRIDDSIILLLHRTIFRRRLIVSSLSKIVRHELSAQTAFNACAANHSVPLLPGNQLAPQPIPEEIPIVPVLERVLSTVQAKPPSIVVHAESIVRCRSRTEWGRRIDD